MNRQVFLALLFFGCTGWSLADVPMPHVFHSSQMLPEEGDKNAGDMESSASTTPSAITPIPLLITPNQEQPDAFGGIFSGPLALKQAHQHMEVAKTPVVTLPDLLGALRVQMIDPPNSIMIHGQFVAVGARLQVYYKGVQSIITLISVQPNQILFGWDTNNTQAAIQVRTPNYAQVLTEPENPSNPLASPAMPEINLDQDAAASKKKSPTPVHHAPFIRH
jgi:hypothetical protein